MTMQKFKAAKPAQAVIVEQLLHVALKHLQSKHHAILGAFEKCFEDRQLKAVGRFVSVRLAQEDNLSCAQVINQLSQ